MESIVQAKYIQKRFSIGDQRFSEIWKLGK